MRSLRDIRLRVTYRSPRALPLRSPAATLALLLVGWAALIVLPAQPVPSPFATIVSAAYPTPELPKPWPLSVAVHAARESHGAFASGGTLAGELRSAGVPGSTAAAVVDATAEVIDLRRIRPGQKYRLYFDAADELVGMRYQVDRQTAWFVAREEDEWAADKVVIPVQIRPVFISAEVVSNLHDSLARQVRHRSGLNELLLRIGDLYGWDVDFNYELQLGDRLDLLVEERYVEGEFSGYGDVLAAEFQVGNRLLPVVRYRDSEAAVSYFAPDGASLRRTFLRSPVKYSRISSRFSPRRVHPVTGVARAHRGVDYVAYPGTPVQATADGIIVESGYGREPGRYVKVRHGGSYSSIYMHLSRIQSGMTVGREIRQGDIVGYVGKTGNATGYHLHYGLEQGGRWVDPMRLQFPAADPVPREDWTAFVQQRDLWVSRLRDGQAARTAVVAGGL